ncbi:MAG: beta galactosidase jelly roll domain-containing protein [Anaerolineae bacterium]|nr:beta galactosidase jelly roll domain-containing protein [Anaerolineae bacterium]
MTASMATTGKPTQAAGIPRPEYPRPDFQRDTWLNLNGAWAFQFDPDNVGVDQRWFESASAAVAGEIVVPYPWQSKLSGVENTTYRGVAWYRHTFSVPTDWTQRVVLHFGAVDYTTTVWVNGKQAGDPHEGGYTPFEFDITDLLTKGENLVVVRVEDPADLREIPHGKQKSVPPDIWDDVTFTPTSGIWQTVWLESRPSVYIQSVRITPDVANQAAIFEIGANTTGTLELAITTPDGKSLAQTIKAGTTKIAIPSPILWDIRQPNLYTVTLTVSESGDVLHTYFGMRTIERVGSEIHLNGRPIYMMSALDQGFWPDGIHTPPTDEAIKWDVEYSLSIGLNMLRKHIKVEDPRFYYWADTLGLLMWCDTPSPTTFNETARNNLLRDLKGMIDRDYNHPSIVLWSPYNESWGLEFRSDTAIQNWMITVYDQIKAWDATRLVVDNSGWRHVKTDIADSHKYTDDRSEWRGVMTLLANDPMSLEVLGHPFFAGRYKYDGEPLMMSEYGVGWGAGRVQEFKWQTDEIRRHANVIGYTYTELYDIEHELAGYTTYDRRPKFVNYDLSIINSEDFIAFDIYKIEPNLVVGKTLTLPVFVSLYGVPTFEQGVVKWRMMRGETLISEGSLDAQAVKPFTVTELAPLSLTVPNDAGKVRLWVDLYDGTTRRATNFADFTILPPQ